MMAAGPKEVPMLTQEIDAPVGGRVVDLTTPTFLAMVEAGLLADRRVYLWGGRLCEKMAKTQAHALTAYAIGEALRPLVTPDWLIWHENPIALDDRHVPLPDVTLIRGPLEVYARGRRHPAAGDVGLIVEVAVSSLTTDLVGRAEKFARALVPTYWVADVIGGRIIEHVDPEIVDGVGRYARVRPHVPGGEIRVVLDAVERGRLPVATLLPWVEGP
jgi:Uma2 family endonuclease